MGEDQKTYAGKVLTTVFIIGILALIVYVVYYTRDFFLIGFISIILSIIIRSISSALQSRFRLPSGLAYVIGLLSILLLLVTPFASISVPLIGQVQKMINNLPQFTEGLQDLLSQLTERAPFLFERIDIDAVINDLMQNLQQIFSSSLTYIADITGSIATFIVMLVLAAFIAKNPKEYSEMALRFIPAKSRNLFIETIGEIESVLKHWITGILLAMFFVGFLSTIGYLIIGLDYFLVFGIAAGFLEIIPFFGPFLGALAPLTYALIESPDKVLPVLIIYLIVQSTENYFFVPFVMRRQVRLPPAMSIFSIMIFFRLFGFMGIIIAIPMLATIVLVAEKMLNRSSEHFNRIVKKVEPPIKHSENDDQDEESAPPSPS